MNTHSDSNNYNNNNDSNGDFINNNDHCHDSDDDDIKLSESALKALNEFYKEQQQLELEIVENKSKKVEEDWVSSLSVQNVFIIISCILATAIKI